METLRIAILLIATLIIFFCGFWAGREDTVYKWHSSDYCVMKKPGDFCITPAGNKQAWPPDVLPVIWPNR